MSVGAGPLHGAVVQRPDGWLRTPLKTEQRVAEKEAREILARDHPAALQEVRCLTARYRSGTFLLGRPPQQVLKRHGDEAAYLGEVIAYQVLAGEGTMPELLSTCDASRTLVVEYLPREAVFAAPGAFDELVGLVASVHTASARWNASISALMAGWEMGSARALPTPAWITDSTAWRQMARRVTEAHGSRHVPLGHLDLKADHVRRSADGRLALIDAETLRPDLTGLPDVITLAFLAKHEDRLPAPHWVRHAYIDHANALGAEWTDNMLVRALTAFAEATGLYSLHGILQ